MKVFFTVTYVLVVILMQACIAYAKKKKDITSKVLFFLHLSVLHAASNYLIYMWVPSKLVATLFYGFFSLNVPWLLAYVGGLAFYISGLYKDKVLMRRISFAFLVTSIVDALSMVCNIGTHHAFDLVSHIGKDGVCYWIPDYKLAYIFHLIYCYFIFVVVSIVLINQFNKTTKIYRNRYLCILSMYLCCVILNSICMYLKLSIDFSPIFYGLLSTFTSFMILKAIPDDIVSVMMKSVSENIKIGIACFDINGKCIYLNKLARMIFKVKINGMSAIEEYRKNIVSGKNPEMHLSNFEEKFVMDDVMHSFAIEYKDFIDANEKIIGSYLKFDDRTHDLRRLEQEIYRGSHDPVTGLYNRKAFFQKAEEIIHSHPEVEFYIVASDIENFKLINDLFGTEMGDRILLAQARMFANASYDYCIHGRISGDRFAMLIPKNKFDQKIAIINTKRIQKLVPELKFKMNMYIGLYEISDREESVESMYDKACLAIESIHGDYELTIAFYDSKVAEKLLYEKTLMNSFNESLAENRFVIFLQPLVDKKTEKVVGAEALSRWNHPSYGLINPEDFLYILEKTDAIFKMDNLIWRSACEKLLEWKELGREDMYISVNISSKDFYFGDLYKIFTGLVEEFQIKPSNLRLEITESIIMKEVKFYKNIISRLRDYGFLVEMDDFGSGYSSLNALKDIPMDVLKMDMEFLNQAESNDSKLKIVKLIINMAKKLDMTVVAEGIECEEQIEALRDAECDIYQGYYYSKPMAVNAFELKYLKGGE